MPRRLGTGVYAKCAKAKASIDIGSICGFAESTTMFSASDVANFLACHHLLRLDRAAAAGQIDKPYFYDPGVEVLRELGARHEQGYLRHLTVDRGLDVAKIPSDVSWAEGAAQTLDALRRGASVVYQASFQNGPCFGRADFLIRFPKPSLLGAWSYEPLETKLALSTKAGALVQLCFYADLVSQIQGAQPAWVHTGLGTGTDAQKYPLAQDITYFRKAKRAFQNPSN